MISLVHRNNCGQSGRGTPSISVITATGIFDDISVTKSHCSRSITSSRTFVGLELANRAWGEILAQYRPVLTVLRSVHVKEML